MAFGFIRDEADLKYLILFSLRFFPYAITEADLLDAVRGKNKHELKERAEKAGVTPAAANMLMTAADLCGEFLPTLEKARAGAFIGRASQGEYFLAQF